MTDSLTPKQISSAENPQYKLLKKIAAAGRERRKLGLTLLDGVHLLTALAESGGQPILLVLRVDAETVPEIAHCLRRFAQTPRIVLSAALFDKIAPVEHATGLLGVLDIPLPLPLPMLQASNCGLLLENIQDPGNLGSILRSAAAAGVDAIYLSQGCAEAWSPKALRAGMGAHFVLAIHEQQDLAQVATQYDKVYATTLSASQSLYACDLTGKIAFAFGNEGAGLSPALLAQTTQQVTIPMPGKVESLNVAAAAAICLFERVRQLQTKIKPTNP